MKNYRVWATISFVTRLEVPAETKEKAETEARKVFNEYGLWEYHNGEAVENQWWDKIEITDVTESKSKNE